MKFLRLTSAGSVGLSGHIRPSNMGVGDIFDEELSSFQSYVLGLYSHQSRGDLDCLFSDYQACFYQGTTADHQRPAGPGPYTIGHDGRIAIQQFHVLQGHSQLVAHDLTEGGLHPLAMGR